MRKETHKYKGEMLGIYILPDDQVLHEPQLRIRQIGASEKDGTFKAMWFYGNLPIDNPLKFEMSVEEVKK